MNEGDYLRSSKNDWLAKVLEHKGECGGCVGHCVCPVEDHKPIKVVVVGLREIINNSAFQQIQH